MKLDKETGKLVPMTEDEIRMKSLVDEVTLLEARLKKLESTWKMYNECEINDEDELDLGSDDDDIKLKKSTSLADNSVSLGQLS